MKIFLTGGTGFVGSHFLASEAAEAHEIIALRRSPSGCPCMSLPREPVWLEKPMDNILAEDLVGCDALVHLASPGVSPKQASWEELYYWNVTVLVRLLKEAKAANVSRVVVAGTFAEYGRSGERYDYIPANAPLEPTYPYAASKAASAVTATAFAVEQKLSLAYLRIFSAFGEGQFEANFWPALRKAALNGTDFNMTAGEQIRDYVAVETVAAMLWAATVSKSILPGQPLVGNVGSGRPVSMREFAEEWWQKLGAKGRLNVGALPYRPNEVMRFVPEVLSMKELLP